MDLEKWSSVQLTQPSSLAIALAIGLSQPRKRPGAVTPGSWNWLFGCGASPRLGQGRRNCGTVPRSGWKVVLSSTLEIAYRVSNCGLDGTGAQSLIWWVARRHSTSSLGWSDDLHLKMRAWRHHRHISVGTCQ